MVWDEIEQGTFRLIEASEQGWVVVGTCAIGQGWIEGRNEPVGIGQFFEDFTPELEYLIIGCFGVYPIVKGKRGSFVVVGKVRDGVCESVGELGTGREYSWFGVVPIGR